MLLKIKQGRDMKTKSHHKIQFDHQMILLGFGSIGKALLPVILEKFKLKKSQITIISADNSGARIAEEYGIAFQLHIITPSN